MSENRPKFFVFCEAETRTVVFAKRGDLDELLISVPGIEVTEISVSRSLDLKAGNFNSTFGPLTGVQARPAPEGAELAKLQLLKKKLEVLFLTNSIVNQVKRNYRAYYNQKSLSQVPLRGEAFMQMLKLAEMDLDLLDHRTDKLFRTFQEKVNACVDVKAVDLQFRSLQTNVTTGSFNFTNENVANEQRN